MKKLFYILLIVAFATACKDEIQMGCQTGILKTGDPNTRINIRCCTKEEHLAGSNTNIGGTAYWDAYTSIKWEPVDSCNKCQ